MIVESAIFDPVTIRRTAQRHALRSEASSRFEKGQEFRLARIGADRTVELLAQWAGGRIAPGRVDTDDREPGPTRVVFRPARVDRLLGAELSGDEQRALLERVGVATEAAAPEELVTVAMVPEALRVQPASGEALAAIVPTWRRDLLIEADIAEEVARVRGYELTPSVTPDTPMPPYRHSPLIVRDLVRETLAGAGLTEAVTPALVSPRHLERFPIREPVMSVDGEPEPTGRTIRVTNPLSQDHSILRQSLIPSLLDVVSTNLRRGADDVAIFEIGRGYAANRETPREWWRLAFVLVGAAQPPSWNQPRRPWDLDDAKGLLELVARRMGLGTPAYVAIGDEPSFHPGRTAAATAKGRTGPALQAIVGELHPGIADAWELRTGDRIIAAEVALTGLSGGGLAAERAPIIGQFQPVERDLAIVVRDDVPAATVLDIVRLEGGEHVHDVRLFDIYRGTPLAADEQSLAVRLTLDAVDRALTDGEVDAAVGAIVRALPSVGGRLRS